VGVFANWGLTPIINASGSVTRLGGAPMPAAVLEAFRSAAGECVPLDELQAAASRRIAHLTGAEAGLVACGASAALTLGAAAMLAGHDPARMEKLPFCEGFPHEFVVAREHRNGYDHAVRAAGARLVEVGFHEALAGAGVRRVEAWEYEAAFGPRTAGVFYVLDARSRPPLAEVVRLAHARELPILVDAAGEATPRANLRGILATGADLVAFSGGKAIRGPQATGILCGRKEYVSSAAVQMLDLDDHPELWDPPEDFIDRTRLLGFPRQGLCRAMKVSKEQIAALLTALDLFAEGAHDGELPAMRKRLETISSSLAALPVRCRLIDPGDGETPPVLHITLPASSGWSAVDVCRRLRKGNPPAQVGHALLHEGTLVIHPLHLDDEKALTLARLLTESLIHTPAGGVRFHREGEAPAEP
jgi:L-seryl-tRNA(Ser) seleniumtransferase